MPIGKTAHVGMSEGEHENSLIEMESRSQDKKDDQATVSSMTVWNVTEHDAGQYICVISENDVAYRIDVAVINGEMETAELPNIDEFILESANVH